MTTHRVKQGDCISSIADKYGFFWNAIWNHSDNFQLKQVRKDPNALLPGDKVVIPEKEMGASSGGTEVKHCFRMLGRPAKMRLSLLINDEARINTKYRLYVDNKLLSESATDNEGYIEEPINPNAKNGKLVIIDDKNNEENYPFNFGSLDPLDTNEGVKKRFFNLGYDQSNLPSAIAEFQHKYGLEITKAMDNTTKSKLKEVFGQ